MTTKNPILLSIIIPVYNVERYLHECIDSVLSSTFKDFELLLVDDGSSDTSGSICDEYAQQDSRIRVFHKSNGGPSSARNLGIELCRASWITFVDADDLVSPTFFNNLWQITNDCPDVDFVQGGCTNYISGSPSSVEQKYDDVISREKGYLFKNFRGLTFSKFFKKNILDDNNLRFDERLRSAEDLQFTLDYVCHVGRYAFSSETGYFYRRDNNTSLTNSNAGQTYENSLLTFKLRYRSVKNFLEQNTISENDSLLRYRQLSSLLAFSVYSLYRKSLDSTTRLEHLRTDYTKEELCVGRYCEGHADRLLFGCLLSNSLYRAFDWAAMFYLNNRSKFHTFLFKR